MQLQLHHQNVSMSSISQLCFVSKESTIQFCFLGILFIIVNINMTDLLATSNDHGYLPIGHSPTFVQPMRNQRIFVQFNHHGIHVVEYDEKEKIRLLLAKVWNHFGTVTDAYYYNEFTCGFITFSSHSEAAEAIMGLRDSIRMRNIMLSFSHDFSEMLQSKKMLSQLFVRVGATNPGLCGVTWAPELPVKKAHSKKNH